MQPAPAAPERAAAAAADDQRQRRAEPRGSRPRGDNPQTGVAVPRGSRRPPSGTNRGVYRNGGVYRSAPRGYNTYNNYYATRAAHYPYGYGAFGLGYFYYDPYRWFPGSYGSVYGSGGYYADPAAITVATAGATTRATASIWASCVCACRRGTRRSTWTATTPGVVDDYDGIASR